ncbi:unnamed protein product [Sympodiomycopsis kandeliae]
MHTARVGNSRSRSPGARDTNRARVSRRKRRRGNSNFAVAEDPTRERQKRLSLSRAQSQPAVHRAIRDSSTSDTSLFQVPLYPYGHLKILHPSSS